jgi:ribosomal protein S18 acetylase RimI-like enzyme
MLTAKLVATDNEIEQMAALSDANLSANISAEIKEKEGFVSWMYTPAILKTLHAIAPSVIVMDGDVLAGYAIVLTPECLDVYSPAKPTYAHASTLMFGELPVGERSFYLMGQICVAEAYRGQGLVEILYEGHRRFYSGVYDLLVTEISVANPRSMKAHQKVGFQVIDRYHDPQGEWDVVLWDWSRPFQR